MNRTDIGFWATDAARESMCNLVASEQLLSVTQELSLMLGCGLGVSQPVAVLGGLWTALMTVIAASMVIGWLGSKVAQLVRRRGGSEAGRRRLSSW